MPTRIALKKTPPPPKAPTLRPTPGLGFQTASTPKRRPLPSFRSSLLKELSVRGSMETTQEEIIIHKTDQVSEERKIDDIRGSPRLLGYIFSMIAGTVALVSVLEFNRERTSNLPLLDQNQDTDNFGQNKYVYFLGGAVYRWKLWGAIYMSAMGVGFSLFTVLAHFDTFLVPNLWNSVFRDGSLAERNWIFFLTFFWATSIHVCTSTLSVGESQANVFFTVWIAFVSTLSNLGVWRESANLPKNFVLGSYRETSYNWMWTAFFSSIFAGAATDMWWNRDEIVLQFRGRTLDLERRDWIIILSVVWTEVALCLLAIVLNESLDDSWRLPCWVDRPGGRRYRCVFGWRHIEGILILVATGAKFWVILEYTAVDGVIPGLSNGYFGVWGSFLNGVFALGTWLRENRGIEYMVKEESDNGLRTPQTKARRESQNS